MAIPILVGDSSVETRQIPGVSSESDPLLTVHEVAALLRVPTSWVYERTRRRGNERLPHIKIGKYLRFRTAEIQRYLGTLRRD